MPSSTSASANAPGPERVPTVRQQFAGLPTLVRVASVVLPTVVVVAALIIDLAVGVAVTVMVVGVAAATAVYFKNRTDRLNAAIDAERGAGPDRAG